MPLMDKLKQAVKGRSSMIEKGIDTAVTQVNKRTKGKYGDTLSKRATDLKKRARDLDEGRAAAGPDQSAPTPPPDLGDIEGPHSPS